MRRIPLEVRAAASLQMTSAWSRAVSGVLDSRRQSGVDSNLQRRGERAVAQLLAVQGFRLASQLRTNEILDTQGRAHGPSDGLSVALARPSLDQSQHRRSA